MPLPAIIPAAILIARTLSKVKINPSTVAKVTKTTSRSKFKPSTFKSAVKGTKKIKVKSSSIKSATKAASKNKIKPNAAKSITKSKIKDSARKAIQKTKDHYTSKDTYINMFKIGNSPHEILKAQRKFKNLTEGIDAILEGDEKKALKSLKKLAFSEGVKGASEFAFSLVENMKQHDFPIEGTMVIEDFIKSNKKSINTYLKKKMEE
jgi:protein-tyrosine-phosphatase